MPRQAMNPERGGLVAVKVWLFRDQQQYLRSLSSLTQLTASALTREAVDGLIERVQQRAQGVSA